MPWKTELDKKYAHLMSSHSLSVYTGNKHGP